MDLELKLIQPIYKRLSYFKRRKSFAGKILICKLKTTTFQWISVCYGMQSLPLCPPLYFQHCELVPHVINSHWAACWWNAPGLFPAKRKRHFLRTSLRIFSRTWQCRGLFCFMELSPITQNCLFCLSPFPRTVWSQRSSTLPAATAVPYCQDCLFFEPLSFVGCGFCFSGNARRGNLFTLYLQKCVWVSWLLSPALLRAGSVWLGGKATANVI